jgi:trans-aconitate 2-methyltransferase
MTKSDRWNADLYEDQHSFVWEYGNDLINLLSPQPQEKILDLGCGTGQLTDQIATTGAEVVGIDNSAAMIAKAQENYPHIEFRVADATNFSFNESFDAIFSNAVLHWVKPPEAAVKCMKKALKPGGRLVVEFGGKGNVNQIVEAIFTELKKYNYQGELVANPWYFPSISEYTTLLEKHNFEVNFATLFSRPTKLDEGDAGLRNWLDMFASNLLSKFSAEEKAEIIKNIERKLKESLYQKGNWIADYKRIRILAVKF